MTTKSTIPQKTQDTIKKEMIRGYKDEENNTKYPSLKSSSEWYEVKYDVLRQIAKDWNWREERKKWKVKVHRISQEKKKKLENCEDEERACESEAEEIVANDMEDMRAANLLRTAAINELNNIIYKKQVIGFNKETNEPIYGVKAAAYQLMNIGKALESAQKISKIAAGEPVEVTEVNSNSNVAVNGRYEVINKLLCSDEHINHEMELLDAIGKAQGCE